MAALILSNMVGERLTVPDPYRCCEQRRESALTVGSFASWWLVRRVDHENEHITRLTTHQAHYLQPLLTIRQVLIGSLGMLSGEARPGIMSWMVV